MFHIVHLCEYLVKQKWRQSSKSDWVTHTVEIHYIIIIHTELWLSLFGPSPSRGTQTAEQTFCRISHYWWYTHQRTLSTTVSPLSSRTTAASWCFTRHARMNSRARPWSVNVWKQEQILPCSQNKTRTSKLSNTGALHVDHAAGFSLHARIWGKV